MQTQITIHPETKMPMVSINAPKINDKSQMMLSEKLWYPHKNLTFDIECKTPQEVYDCIDMYITKGMTTADEQLEKYIVFQKYEYFKYILDRYANHIKDWVHILVTAVMLQCHVFFFTATLQAYIEVHGCLMPIDPSKDEVLWICLDTHYLDALLVITEYTSLDTKWLDYFGKPGLTMEEIKEEYQRFDKLNPNNPRNLVYALRSHDVPLAIELLEGGACVDVWNNFPMRLCLERQAIKEDPQYSKLVRLLLNGGAKIPAYYKELKQQALSDAYKILDAFKAVNTWSKLTTSNPGKYEAKYDETEKKEPVLSRPSVPVIEKPVFRIPNLASLLASKGTNPQ